MSQITAVERALAASGLLERLRECEQLPTPPGIAERILGLADDPGSTMGDVAEVVAADPALATKLLKLANSPIYGQRRQVETLKQACILLGMAATLTSALSFALVDSFRNRRACGIDHVMFWRRSLASASACRNIGRKMKFPQSDAFFMAGLIQDVGMLAVETIEPDLYSGLGADQSNQQYLTEFERAYIGTDHASIGAWLLNEWELPEKYCISTHFSHDPSAAIALAEHSQIAVSAAVSGLIADAIYSSQADQSFHEAFSAASEVLKLDLDQFLEIVLATCADISALGDMFDLDLGSIAEIEERQSMLLEIAGQATPRAAAS